MTSTTNLNGEIQNAIDSVVNHNPEMKLEGKVSQKDSEETDKQLKSDETKSTASGISKAMKFFSKLFKVSRKIEKYADKVDTSDDEKNDWPIKWKVENS